MELWRYEHDLLDHIWMFDSKINRNAFIREGTCQWSFLDMKVGEPRPQVIDERVVLKE